MCERARQPLLPSWVGTCGRAQSPTCVIASVATTPPRVCDDSRACLSHASDAAGVPAIETPSSTDPSPLQAVERYDCRRERGLSVLRGCAPDNSAPSADVMVAAGLSTTADDFHNDQTWPSDDVRRATALTSIVLQNDFGRPSAQD
jgi:hypothetical protein